jgi:sodium/potassium-transporting ATPase subunit alpha
VNVLCSVRPLADSFSFPTPISTQDKTGTLTQNKMHVEDAAIYDVTFEVPTLRQQLESAQGLVVENLRQLPAVATICNAAIFEGSSSGSNRIIGDATGKGRHSHITLLNSSHTTRFLF